MKSYCGEDKPPGLQEGRKYDKHIPYNFVHKDIFFEI